MRAWIFHMLAAPTEIWFWNVGCMAIGEFRCGKQTFLWPASESMSWSQMAGASSGALKSLEQKRRRENAIRQRQGLTQRMCRVVLAIFCLSNYCLDFALEYAKSASRKRRKIWNLEEPEPCLIQEWFLATPVDQLLTLLHSETPADQSVHVEASKYVATRRVVAWLVDENFKRFRAPDALQLVAQYGVELRRFDLQHGFRVDRCSGAQLNSAGRHWVRTLKRRFGISRRYLPLAEPLSADHVQSKAGPEPNFWNFFFVVL